MGPYGPQPGLSPNPARAAAWSAAEARAGDTERPHKGTTARLYSDKFYVYSYMFVGPGSNFI